MVSLALLLIGYSLFSAIGLAITHFRRDNFQAHSASRTAGLLLLCALAMLQLAHGGWLYLGLPWVASIPYKMVLFAVAPCFFMYSRPLLDPQHPTPTLHSAIRHGFPAVMAAFLPGALALPLAFWVGSGYLVWLGRSLYALRQERVNFQHEIKLLGVVFVIAIAVSLFGMMSPIPSDKLFFACYAVAIGVAFFLVQTTLGMRPHLQTEVAEMAQTAYANSTLAHVDCEAALTRLEHLMHNEECYKDPELDLPGLARRLDVSPHQLSELLNSRLGKGFSRYLREHRTAAAKAMLCAEAKASVLSVGLSVGFTSQSNFYEAFRDLEGMTPGQYRKLHTRQQDQTTPPSNG